MQGAQGQDGTAWAPLSAPRLTAPTHRGTKESVFCSVVGSSSKREAMSLPWGTATRRYLIFSPAFRRPTRLWAPWDEDPSSDRSPSLLSGPPQTIWDPTQEAFSLQLTSQDFLANPHGPSPRRALEPCSSPFLLPWDHRPHPCSWGSPGQTKRMGTATGYGAMLT